MIVRLKDGTQEFISDENDLLNLVEEKLGRDISYELKFIIEYLKGEFIDEDEMAEDIRREYEDEMIILENNLDEIYGLTSTLINDLSKLENQELLVCLKKSRVWRWFKESEQK